MFRIFTEKITGRLQRYHPCTVDSCSYPLSPLCPCVSDCHGRLINVAGHRSATQSSTSQESKSAEMAVDDDPATCSKTLRERGSWWKVDLGSEHVVSSLTLLTIESE